MDWGHGEGRGGLHEKLKIQCVGEGGKITKGSLGVFQAVRSLMELNII